jgi:murein DD-endopeptidase MepM/ murein hydrolase activator NlpD
MNNKEKKFTNFLKRNAGYLVLTFCILAIGFSTALIAINSAEKPNLDGELNAPIDKPIEDNTPVTGEDSLPDVEVNGPSGNEPEVPVVSVITFISPIKNPTLVEEFSDALVWSSTLNRYESHKAIDYFAEEGTSVFAVYDGEVESVENDLIKGITVTINHGDGLKTVYNSLGEDVTVTVGDKVTKGQTIGFVSVTNRKEYKEGAHLHFEVSLNGETVNPLNYLESLDK